MEFTQATKVVQRPRTNYSGWLFETYEKTAGLVIICLLLVTTGCTNTRGLNSDLDAPVTHSSDADKSEFRDKLPISRTKIKYAHVIKEFVGLSEHDAESLAAEQAREFRVGARDGKGLPGIANLVDGRITVVVVDGVVTDADVEEISFR